MQNTIARLAIKRFLIILAISVTLTVVANEAFYRLQRDPYDRAAREVELVIPDGTAAMIAQGEPVPSVPEEMAFVVGDVLVVRNEDSQDHQLGPLWIPANSSARLNLDEPLEYVTRCSFQPSSYMGLDVRMPTTLGTRFQGLLLAAPATLIFLFLYSLVVYPLQPVQKKDASERGDFVREKNTTGE